jgi:hypothetical protein
MSAVLPTDLPRAVEIRCEDCARDLGRSAPTLVVAEHETDHWELIALGERIPTRVANSASPGSPRAWLRGRTIVEHHPRGRSVFLACRRCKRQGWRRQSKLYGVAEAARMAGRSDAYLSLA